MYVSLFLSFFFFLVVVVVLLLVLVLFVVGGFCGFFVVFLFFGEGWGFFVCGACFWGLVFIVLVLLLLGVKLHIHKTFILNVILPPCIMHFLIY